MTALILDLLKKFGLKTTALTLADVARRRIPKQSAKLARQSMDAAGMDRRQQGGTDKAVCPVKTCILEHASSFQLAILRFTT